jgi:hypothetical protein
MKNRNTVLPALLCLIFIMACVIPGTAANPESEPASSADMERIQAMVEETVAAAIAQTEQAAPTPEMSMEQPAETPISTPQTTGSSLSAQSDGTTLFVDERAKFQLNVSPGWLPVRVNEQEYYDAFSLPVAADESVQRALTDIKSLDPGTFRLFIFDLQDGHMTSGVITNINLLWDLEGGISLADEVDIKAASEELAASVPGLSVDAYSLESTANDTPIGVIVSNTPGKAFDGITDVVFYQKQVYVNLPAGALVISFTTEQNFKDATLPFFDTMVESLKVNSE